MTSLGEAFDIAVGRLAAVPGFAAGSEQLDLVLAGLDVDVEEAHVFMQSRTLAGWSAIGDGEMMERASEQGWDLERFVQSVLAGMCVEALVTGLMFGKLHAEETADA